MISTYFFTSGVFIHFNGSAARTIRELENLIFKGSSETPMSRHDRQNREESIAQLLLAEAQKKYEHHNEADDFLRIVLLEFPESPNIPKDACTVFSYQHDFKSLEQVE